MVREKVIKIIARELDFEEKDITLDTEFEEDLKIDSLGILQISSELEETFDIEIPIRSAKKIKTVSDLVNVVIEKV